MRISGSPKWEGLMLGLGVLLAACFVMAHSFGQTGKLRVTVGVGAGQDKEIWITPGDGTSFKDCPMCPELVVVPAGRFEMGSTPEEIDALDKQHQDFPSYKQFGNQFTAEGPQHEVRILKPFAAGKFAVTFDEWAACVADKGCNGYEPKDEGWGYGRRPVINVSWVDAKAYVSWLSNKTGKEYRLLSEAEREYVARAGTTTPFWWGSSISTDQANYNGNYAFGGGPTGEYRKQTVPVDSFQANPWGLYQVHGNLWEWVEDCWHDDYNGAPTDGSAWTTGDCSRRVERGGAPGSFPGWLRAAHRFGKFGRTVFRYHHSGFRVARAIAP